MNLENLFEDEKYLEKQINYFIKQKQIREITTNKELVNSHLKKARHNLTFYKLNKNNEEFLDWLIIILYYSLYHCALALIINKNYTSKNHYATFLLLIKEYKISKKEFELINDLSINKEDVNFYTNLKEDRHNANYLTRTKFSKELIEEYEFGVINFLNKVENILNLK